MHKLVTWNALYIYDVKWKYFYIKHNFFHAFTVPFINLTSHLCINVTVYA